MAKLAPTSIKYIIKARIKADGVVEKPDVIGAIFGQTEGLMGSDLNLRELQRTGRIGRIEVKIKSKDGKSEGEIIIPSSLDAAETSLLAATLETIERVGPCTAEITLESVEDTRSERRRYVVEKAQEILKDLTESGVPDSAEISEQVKEAVRTQEISTYQGLPCGPNLTDSESVIILEGRADIINLLKHGIRNTIAIEGTSIPQAIIDLCKEKIATVFIDGDRGGELILKELLQVADIDYVAKAPPGKEVEELSKKEVYKALREKVSAKFEMIKRKEQPEKIKKPEEKKPYIKEKRYKIRLKPRQRELFRKTLEELVGTRAACIFNSKNELLGKVPVTELINTIRTVDNPYVVIFDGKVDFKLNLIAKKKGIKYLVGMEKEEFRSPIIILCRRDLE